MGVGAVGGRGASLDAVHTPAPVGSWFLSRLGRGWARGRGREETCAPWDHEATLTASPAKWGHAHCLAWKMGPCPIVDTVAASPSVPVGSGGTERAPGNVLGFHLSPMPGSHGPSSEGPRTDPTPTPLAPHSDLHPHTPTWVCCSGTELASARAGAVACRSPDEKEPPDRQGDRETQAVCGTR